MSGIQTSLRAGWSGVLAAAVISSLGVAEVRAGTWAEEHAAWRAERVAALTKPDGWLSLIGLHFLKPGPNTVGSAKGNDVVLAAGPARVGTATLAEDGTVTLALAAEAGAQIDGWAMGGGVLRTGEGKVKPTLVTCGTVSFFAIERGGKKALRVKDSAAERRAHFLGIDYFPPDPAWRVTARWVAFEKSRQIPIVNILGQTSPGLVPGKAVFERDGKTYELLAIDDGPGEPLFFVIADATSGKETYAAARFIYADLPKDGTVILDFNRAENPPCAFTPFATCPLPPKENRLPFAVTAGEKTYRGAHD
ncbi:MAG: DUF1684 domain-containing protein [Verrucomicrobia bacterium]|nr:DUF1684 domain-containing protein [Verrucomicrobiota bacterium]